MTGPRAMVSHNVVTTAQNSRANDDDKCSKSRDFKRHTTVRIIPDHIPVSSYSRRVLRYMVLREGRLNLGAGTPTGKSPAEKTIVVEDHGGVEARVGCYRQSRRRWKKFSVRARSETRFPRCPVTRSRRSRSLRQSCTSSGAVWLRREPWPRPPCLLSAGLSIGAGPMAQSVLSANGHIASSGSTTTTVPTAGTSAGPASTAPVGTVNQSGATEPVPARNAPSAQADAVVASTPSPPSASIAPSRLADRGRDGLARPGAGRHRHCLDNDDHDHDADRHDRDAPVHDHTTIPVSSASGGAAPVGGSGSTGKQRDRWQRLWLVGIRTRVAPATRGTTGYLRGNGTGGYTGRAEARVALGTPVRRATAGQRSWWNAGTATAAGAPTTGHPPHTHCP